jgi:PAP2 superfamily
MFRFACIFLCASLLQAEGIKFCYDRDVYKTLINLRASSCMHVADLCKWDEVAQTKFEQAGLTGGKAQRAYTYLYLAQADAAVLSSQVSGAYAGSLDPVSSDVIALFAPDVKREKSDPYSEKLAELVVAKVKERMAEEGDHWKPLYIDCLSDYWPPCPPALDDPFWEWQALEIEAAQTPMTRAKKGVVEYWRDLGNWRMLANCHLFDSDPSLDEAIEVRAAVAAALYDTTIVAFSAKEHYKVPRPEGRAIIPIPNNPSYPSAHAAEAAAAAAVLTRYFPEESTQWCEWAQQAGYSRIWAGVHYPIDDESGQCVGSNVAETILMETR